MKEALDIRVRGIVQGVGFRPFVYKLAKRHLISGWVLNDYEGVFIHAEGEPQLLDEFVLAIADDAPAAADISEIEMKEVPLQDCEGFEIRESSKDDPDDITKISADLGICDDCAQELLDSDNRRFRYPFINCTNCGPRFTIINDLPYDRPNTSMASFEMCNDCEAEYTDPLDRRFHAQPNACFTCGPELTWTPCVDGKAQLEERVVASDQTSSDELLERTVSLIVQGGIAAIKGLGGFHLVCNAQSSEAVARLRTRKQRDGKPFAVMVADVEAAREWCHVSEAEAALLKSPARPIVLLQKKEDASIAAGVADGLKELGVMLPTTPLQVLLMADVQKAADIRMLVMTSGNVSGEPIVIDDDIACERLSRVADCVLGNNRPILTRFDDSVARVLNIGELEAIQFIRRARGYAPGAIPIGYGAQESSEPMDAANTTEATNDSYITISDGNMRERPQVLAVGSEQKNTFTFTRAADAFVSSYIGDLEDADTFDAWLEAKTHMEKLFRLTPQVLACDLHPEYVASKWARKKAFSSGLPLTEVQHHHAHIVSALAEHNLFGPCCGIAFDGTGYGPDGSLWGGETLISNQIDYERFANLTYMPMPGGAACIHRPLRMAYGMLWTYDLLEHPGAAATLDALGDQANVCASMIEEGLNTPYTSAMGRFFDGVAALLGVCVDPTYEGEPAILLDGIRAKEDISPEAAVEAAGRYTFTFQKNAATSTSTAHDTSVVVIDGEQVITAVLDDIQEDVPLSVISLRFHVAVVNLVVALAELVRSAYDISLVVLSGGCFMNRFLVEQATAQLGAVGFTVALNSSLPPNDGCVSYGQAVVASVSR